MRGGSMLTVYLTLVSPSFRLYSVVGWCVCAVVAW